MYIILIYKHYKIKNIIGNNSLPISHSFNKNMFLPRNCFALRHRTGKTERYLKGEKT